QTTPKADLALELKVNTKYSALAQHILERSKDYSPFQRHVARPLVAIREFTYIEILWKLRIKK
ncbi:hypothetical protein, partial [Carboxylicivirga marina]|uniref:hypothetical protein n=1 Tax=Carboxylicivirga marina TaxID=2800988 RepID=UPI003D327C44